MKTTKFLCFSLSIFLLFSLCACGGESSNNSTTSSQPSQTNPATDTKPVAVTKPINIDAVTQISDVAEIKIVNVFTSDDVKPPRPSGYYTHYPASSGCTYLVVVMDVKNLGTNSVYADEIISVKMSVGGKEYNASTVVETEEGAGLDKGSWTSIKALDVARVYQMYSIPSNTDLQNFSITIENGQDIYSSDFSLSSFESKLKTVGIGEIITDNETISLTVDSIEFKNTLYPPRPSGYYHYYEAEHGKTYLIVKITATNLKGTKMKYDSIAGLSCVYNEKYNYSFFTVLEEDGGEDLTGTSSLYAISPLDKGVVYYMAEVPTQVAEGPVEITFYIAGNYYRYSL